ncbi:MAG: murein biosynthesis integral membrane protein MurJ [Candidatus Nealsonbacteria bacterium RBG_13_36_15]|uniref:Probable lipid II flippase MurJ n=1 Tax=Candidatus Nealsonbacteria bacterium RBG_13_36_15 TaxID=1801660 RepID=A0A1G2DUV6_9BACT|nr:MAG: murein biosynthesis integral membrane protein MurJ [Candidatus Nealsonbacteria bacterium RBG_13_36_15]
MVINNILNSQTKTITFAAILLAFSAGLSRLLGLLRNSLLAGQFGTGPEVNIYLAAFRIPDFVYNFLVVGGLSVAFLPIFSEYFSKEKEKAWEMVNNVLNVFLFFLFLSSLILFIFAPILIKFIVPGFSVKDQNLTALLTRIMFLSPIFFGLSSIFSGVLHYFNRFLIYSLAPIFYNLGIISGILFLYPRFGLPGLAYGVILGAFLHWIIQTPVVRNCGFHYRALFNLKHPAIKEIFKLMVPRSFAVAGQQINLIVVTAIASTIVGGIAIFNYANDLYYFPIGIIGIPFALAVFPVLSKNWAEGQKEKFLENFSSVFRQIIFLILPASFLIFVLRAQLVRLVLGSLGSGSFSWLDTKLTAASLGLFSVGILASALIPFVSRAFFAFQDTKTPTLIAFTAIALNIFLSFSLVWLLSFPNFFQILIADTLKLGGIGDISIIGLPLAFSLAAILQSFLLLALLNKKLGGIKGGEIFSSFQKVFVLSVFSGFIVYFNLHFLGRFFTTEKVWGILTQTALAGLTGIIFYLAITYFLKFPELRTITSSFHKQFKKEVTSSEIAEP